MAISVSADVVTLPDRNLGSPLPVKYSQIDPDPEQPRTIFIPESIEALADNIEDNAKRNGGNGQETAVKLRLNPEKKGRFVLIDGERRWRAFGLIAERRHIDPIVLATIEVVTDPKAYRRKSIIANLFREDLHPLDEARSFDQLRVDGETLESIAKIRGKSITYIQNYLAVHGLPDEVKKLMLPNRDKDLRLSITSAIDIARSIPASDPNLRIEVANEAIERNLGVVDTRSLIEIRTGTTGHAVGGRLRKPSDDYQVLATFLGRTYRAADRMVRLDIDELYLYRKDEDTARANDARVIRSTIQTLESLYKKVVTDPRRRGA